MFTFTVIILLGTTSVWAHYDSANQYEVDNRVSYGVYNRQDEAGSEPANSEPAGSESGSSESGSSESGGSESSGSESGGSESGGSEPGAYEPAGSEADESETAESETAPSKKAPSPAVLLSFLAVEVIGLGIIFGLGLASAATQRNALQEKNEEAQRALGSAETEIAEGLETLAKLCESIDANSEVSLAMLGTKIALVGDPLSQMALVEVEKVLTMLIAANAANRCT